MRNLRLAFRMLLRTPFVTGVAILSLALGIGANAAIFSLFEQMLLRPLPVQEPEELVNLIAPGPKPGNISCSLAGDCDAVFSYPMFRDLQAAETGFSGIAAHRSFDANLAFENQTLDGDGMLVSGSYFPLLGLRPALGRLLGPADDRTVGSNFVAVLSYAYWANYLGSDPDVLGEVVIINGHPMTIVGVAPRGFHGTTLGLQPRVFVPITMRGLMAPGFDGFGNRQSYWAYLFGRLEPGVSIERAGEAINRVYRGIITEVEAPLQPGIPDRMMEQFRAKQIVLQPGDHGQSSLQGQARVPLLLLFGITAIVLLIACANIANLLLARGASRGMEMAVRLSLGASRRHVLVQLLTESCLLALLGGLASLLVARATLVFVGSMAPPETVATLDLGLRPDVVIFTGALAIGTGLLFGMFPALHGTRPDLATTIRANAGHVVGGGRGAARFRASLVTAQIALSMMLLVAAGLFLRSLLNVSQVDLGLRVENLVTFRISPELNGYEPARAGVLFQRVEDELAAIPGVSQVSASLVPFLSGDTWTTDVSVEGFESPPGADEGASYSAVGAGFFRTLGIPLLAGREFTDADSQDAPLVAMVNEAFAEKFGLGRDPVGKFMSMQGESDELNVQIVGMVQDAKYSDVKDDIPPQFFTPYRQDDAIGALNFYVRTEADPGQVLRVVSSVIAGLDPNLPVDNLKTMPQQVRESVFLDRFISILSAAFAVLATLLAAIGLYGVLAYTVAQRTREIGVRMALGASAGRVRGIVLQQVGRMMLAGGIIGIAAALAVGRAAGSLLFGLEGEDPAVFGLAVLVLGLVTFAAGYLPARRAALVNPVDALRQE